MSHLSRADRWSWPELTRAFVDSSNSLELHLTDAHVEALSVQVFSAMNGPLRQFHTLGHLAAFTPRDALEQLAVIYHDVVYWTVDGGWPTSFRASIESVCPSGQESSLLAPAADIPCYADILVVFGKEPGQPLGRTGVNELMSALCLSVALGERLGRERTLAAAVCIEATIPFRGPQARGLLLSRLTSLDLKQANLSDWIRRAVHMANEDVASFRDPDPGLFLAGTWDLLPELNPSLRISSVFTIREYRKALEGMAGFFGFLSPELLYDAWDGEPGEAEFARWKVQAQENLTVARAYLGAKLMAAALLEALADQSGGDVPLSLFMGVSTGEPKRRMEHLLPASRPLHAEDVVYDLLHHGRASESSFDLTNSPLAAWVWLQLDPHQRVDFLSRTAAFFASKLSARVFLSGWPSHLISGLAKALAQFVPTRSVRLKEWIQTPQQ